jgi:hypothetical protein
MQLFAGVCNSTCSVLNIFLACLMLHAEVFKRIKKSQNNSSQVKLLLMLFVPKNSPVVL